MNLSGKKGLVVGIANEHSIAFGCAKAFFAAGADLAVTYINDKAETYVRPLAHQINSSIVLPMDVRNEAHISFVFNTIQTKWKRLDFFTRNSICSKS